MNNKTDSVNESPKTTKGTIAIEKLAVVLGFSLSCLLIFNGTFLMAGMTLPAVQYLLFAIAPFGLSLIFALIILAGKAISSRRDSKTTSDR